MDGVNGAAVAAAERCAVRLVDSCDTMAAALLGGGLTMWERRMEAISDIDMFTYLDVDVLPGLDDIVALARRAGLEPRDVRSRLFLSEFRCTLEGYDTNIKFFTVAKLLQSSAEPPNLSEIHLEEQHTYLTYHLLAERGERVSSVLRQVQEASGAQVEATCELALEAYGKVVSGAIKQGIYRGTEPHVAWLAGDMAVQYLVMLAYLQAGRYPAPFKWRASQSSLSTVPAGDELFDALAGLRASVGSLGDFLEALHAAEQALSDDCRRHPWSRFRDDRWWWTSYEPVTRQAAETPFPVPRPERSAPVASHAQLP